jgi:hypothetical protein
MPKLMKNVENTCSKLTQNISHLVYKVIHKQQKLIQWDFSGTTLSKQW